MVFDSQASDLLPGGDTATNDVYRRDLDTGSLVQVSLDVDGGPTNGFSDKASVSADGRYVAFASGATDLVVGVGSTGNYYVRDVLVHTTTLVSVNDQGRAVGGGGGNARLLPDASGVTFDTSAPALPDDDNGVRDVYLRTGLQYPANRPPVANAGPDQTVREDRSTTLDGRRSQDPEHAPLAFLRTQIGGPAATLRDEDTAQPTVDPVAVESTQVLTFRVRVTDPSGATNTNEVSVTVNPK